MQKHILDSRGHAIAPIASVNMKYNSVQITVSIMCCYCKDRADSGTTPAGEKLMPKMSFYLGGSIPRDCEAEEDPASLEAKTLFKGRMILAYFFFFFIKKSEEYYFFTGSLNVLL